MSPQSILIVFIGLRLCQFAVELAIAAVNRRHYLTPARQEHACRTLGIARDEFAKTLAYTTDKYRFGLVSDFVGLGALLVFLAAGGLGWAEAWAAGLSSWAGGGATTTGLAFFAILAVLSGALSLPFDWYRTFTIEERHGFNRQTRRGFLADRIKGALVGVLLGGPILALLLWIMSSPGPWWWIWAWVALSAFSILTAWLYPTFLAPLFNKFTPLPDGELKNRIDALAARVGFRTAGVHVMDASRRSSHGNAYFTGVFGRKRIVLFDTLLKTLDAPETVAVLAHELGHFKLHHVRWQILRGMAMTGLTFWLLSLCLPLKEFYDAFGLGGVTAHGALVVFGSWFGLMDFALQPLGSWLSRRHEFAADAFARRHLNGDGGSLRQALLKLRETSHSMPLAHPVYSAVYLSHPPLLERLSALA